YDPCATTPAYFSLYSSGHHRALHSFPTRRSSDLSVMRASGPTRARHAPPPKFSGRPKTKRRAASALTASTASTTRRPRARCFSRSEEHTSELQSPYDLVCRLLLEKKKKNKHSTYK